jgi:AcrR family transcriptional regulator
MTRTVNNVKRRYDSSARRARAEQISGELLDTARTMLLRDGYAATTLPNLARECGVSAESVYKRFPGKAALVRAVVTRALQGIGPLPAETRSDALAPVDLAALLRGWGALAAEVAPRLAPILLLVHGAAAHDRELARIAAEIDEDRRTRMTHNARRIAEAGHLPEALSIERAGDILWTYSSPQIYDLLVQRSGWTMKQYGEFIARGISAHLITPPADADLRPTK